MSSEIQFEKALTRLETIVQDLEEGNVSLDEALKRYEEGVKLSRACQDKLVQAEKKIQVLTKTLSGSLKKEPFDPEDVQEETEESSVKKRRKPKAAAKEEGKNESEDEDLLF